MKEKRRFKILLYPEYFKRREVLLIKGGPIRVISTPKRHYSKWYYKLLNVITFKLFFNYRETYIVERL